MQEQTWVPVSYTGHTRDISRLEIDSLKSLLPRKSSTSRMAPITDQLIHLPVATTLKKKNVIQIACSDA
jgi:hypothetical protein